jgi:hypothetical protein
LKNETINIHPLDVKNYIEKHLNNIFEENIKIDVDEKRNTYIINKIKEVEIYDFWNKEDEELLKDFENYSFKGDCIGTIFFFLSGFWEYTHTYLKDNFGRFPAIESFQYKKNVLEEPVADILIDKLSKELNLTYKNFYTRKNVFITHDVDILQGFKGFRFMRSLVGDVLKRKKISLVVDKIIKKLKQIDPFSVFNLIEIHKKYGTTGTFFFLPDNQPKKFGNGYKLHRNIKHLQLLEKEIMAINGSIGIHYDARYLEENRMKNDLDNLKNVFSSIMEAGRAHYLLFDITKSFKILENSGIKIDTTCSYADRVGFRFGTCKPFNPYNFEKNREYGLLEIPLVVMDGTLQSKKYMGLTPKEGLKKIKELINKTIRYKGVFTLLSPWPM